MKPVLALRHVPHEGLGTIERALADRGLQCQTLDLPAAPPREFNPCQWAALIVMGGPMNVDQTDRHPFLADEVRWLRQALDANLPVLGVCLGSQLLAKALGARVYANAVKEIGWYEVQWLPAAAEDPLFRDSPARSTVFQWHGDTFDLPHGAVHLARSRQCPNQVFRFGRAAYGLQFHMEVTADMVESWLCEPGNCGELAGLDYIDVAAIRRHMSTKLPTMDSLGRRVFDRFAELCRAGAMH